MPTSGSGDLMFQLLSQAFTGMFSPKKQDGLKALSIGNNANGTPRDIPGYGPNPYGLSGRDLVGYWSSLDENTPDKMNYGKAKAMAASSPGSPFGQWFNAGGFGSRGSIMGAAAYNRALSGGGGGNWGMQGNMDYLRFMGGLLG